MGYVGKKTGFHFIYFFQFLGLFFQLPVLLIDIFCTFLNGLFKFLFFSFQLNGTPPLDYKVRQHE